MTWYQEINNPPIYKTQAVNSPAGFKEHSGAFQFTKGKARSNEHTKQINELKIRKGWEVAIAPVKSLPVTLFMNYMSGNSLQIISISMTLMLFVNPIKAILGLNETFEFLNIEEKEEGLGFDILMIKLAFIGSQILGLAVGVWKLNNMGLIPNSTSDWLSWETYAQFNELSAGIY